MTAATASDFVAALIAASLAAAAEGFESAPLPCIQTANVAGASNLFRKALGFEIRHHIPHVSAYASWGNTAMVLLQTGARPGRFERAQCIVDCAPFTPATYRIATRQLHQLHRRVQSTMESSGTALHLAPPSLQPWNAWEFSCVDADGNTLVFTQPVAVTVAADRREPR